MVFFAGACAHELVQCIYICQYSAMFLRKIRLFALGLLPLILFALLVYRIRLNEPRTAYIGRVQDRKAQSVALRALSSQLKRHPYAREVKVYWRSAAMPKGRITNYIFFNRRKSRLVFSASSKVGWMLDEKSVHEWAKLGRFDGFGAASANP